MINIRGKGPNNGRKLFITSLKDVVTEREGRLKIWEMDLAVGERYNGNWGTEIKSLWKCNNVLWSGENELVVRENRPTIERNGLAVYEKKY